PTNGQNGISVHFDMDPSSNKAEAQFAVEYTTDVQDASPTWLNVTDRLTFGPGDAPDAGNANHVATIGTDPTDDVYLQTNAGNATIIAATHATITGPRVGGSNPPWLNALTLSLPAGADDSANFAFRIVNAATGTAETSVAPGAAGPSFKNWRFNDI